MESSYLFKCTRYSARVKVPLVPGKWPCFRCLAWCPPLLHIYVEMVVGFNAVLPHIYVWLALLFCAEHALTPCPQYWDITNSSVIVYSLKLVWWVSDNMIIVTVDHSDHMTGKPKKCHQCLDLVEKLAPGSGKWFINKHDKYDNCGILRGGRGPLVSDSQKDWLRSHPVPSHTPRARG